MNDRRRYRNSYQTNHALKMIATRSGVRALKKNITPLPDVEIMEGIVFNVSAYLAGEGSPFA